MRPSWEFVLAKLRGTRAVLRAGELSEAAGRPKRRRPYRRYCAVVEAALVHLVGSMVPGPRRSDGHENGFGPLLAHLLSLG